MTGEVRLAGGADRMHIHRDLAFRLLESRDLDRLLPECLDAAIRLSGMDCGAVYLVDEHGALRMACSTGIAAETAREVSCLAAQREETQATLSGEPVYTSVERESPLPYPALLREALRAIALIPIASQGRVIASFALASHVLDEAPLDGRSDVESIAALVGNAILRLQAERALAESEERYRALVEHSPDAIALIDRVGNVLAANRQCAHLMGYDDLPDPGPLNVFDRVGEQDRPRVQADFARALETGALRQTTFQAVRCDGATFTFEVSGAMIPGDTPKLMIIGRDTRDLQRADAERTLLYERERQRRRLAEALHKAGTALSGTLDFDSVLDRMLDEIGWIVPYDSASVMTVDETAGKSRVVRERGYAAFASHEAASAVLGLEFDIAATPNLRRLIIERKPLLIADTRQYPGWIEVPAAAHICSWIGAPIIVDDHVIAIFSLDKRQPGYYQPDHLAYLAPFVVQASLAAQNARLHAETVKALARERRLNALTRAVNAVSDLYHMLDELPRIVAEVLEADSAIVWLLAPNGMTVSQCTSYGVDPRVFADRSVAGGMGVVRSVMDTLAAFHLGAGRPGDSSRPSFVPAGGQDALVAPIVSNRKCFGALAVFNADASRRFSQRDVDLAESVGGQIGGAIQRSRLFEEVRSMAITDSVTGLFNRGHFLELAAHELERIRASGGKMTIMMLDVDHFKTVNDTYGHIVGDQVLRAVAECCRRNLRITDVLARYGGDEFAILLSETGSNDVRRAAERLRATIAQLKVKPAGSAQSVQPAGGGSYSVTVSIGLSICSGVPYPDLELLLAQADRALYAAKQNGRNCVSVWQD